MRHAIVIETPDGFVPEMSPRTADVVDHLALLMRDCGTWWLNQAKIYEDGEDE